jgi:hypothetical protein
MKYIIMAILMKAKGFLFQLPSSLVRTGQYYGGTLTQIIKTGPLSVIL